MKRNQHDDTERQKTSATLKKIHIIYHSYLKLVSIIFISIFLYIIIICYGL